MIEQLTAEGYEQTKEKLRDLELRLADVERRTDFPLERIESVCRSYRMVMREMKREVVLYETKEARKKRLIAS